MSKAIPPEEVLRAHLGGKIGVEVVSRLLTERDLSTIYTPGVADACRAIELAPDSVFQFTSKQNLVAVASDGTAVLGLGDIGAVASIPVLEGKAALFKVFGRINAWPVPLVGVRTEGDRGRTDVDAFVEAVYRLHPMYGGINIEDVAGPECFEVEQRLDSQLDIPVFHDDQWGTAIITLAAVINYCRLTGKQMHELRVVINGAGAAGIAVADTMATEGVRHMVLVDSKGVVHSEREDLTRHKERFAVDTPARTLADAMRGADVFIGVSVGGCVSGDMVSTMNEFPAIFAMANPIPEILPEAVREALSGREYIVATGRSDYPNQINNVLGFPFIFRGALDVRARSISMGMKKAASGALAELARNPAIPDEVQSAYGRTFSFGPEYIIPVPFDPRLLEHVGGAVARAALADGTSKFSRRVPAGDILRLPPAQGEDETGLSIGARICDLAYHDGKCYVEISHNGRRSYVQCAEDVGIEHDPMDPARDTHINPQKRPGSFCALAARCLGVNVMLGLKRSDSGACRLVTIATEGGWCWDETQ